VRTFALLTTPLFGTIHDRMAVGAHSHSMVPGGFDVMS
jgi:hypothetical protein